MILAEAVMRPDGMTLAGPGLELTDSLIERIRNIGVGSIVVEGSHGGGNAAELETVYTNLPHIFRRHTNDAFMMTLHNMLSQYFKRRIAEIKAAAEAARLEAEEKARKKAEAAEAAKKAAEDEAGTP